MEKFIRNLLLFSPLIFFAYTPWTLYPAIFGRSILFQTIIEVILIALLVNSLIVNKRSVSSFRFQVSGFKFQEIFYHPIALSLIIFTLVQFASFLFSVDREASFWGSMSRMDGIFSWLHMVLFFFLLILFFGRSRYKEDSEQNSVGIWNMKHETWNRFFLINSVIASILSILAIIQHYHDLVPNYIIQSGRVYATFGNPVFFAPYLLFSIFFTLILLIPHLNPPPQGGGEEGVFPPLEGEGKRQRIRLKGLIGLIVLQIIALFWTGSQGAIGGFLVGILLMFIRGTLVYKGAPYKRIYWATLIGLLGLIVFVGFSKLGLNEFLKSPQLSKIEGLETRLTAWKMGLQAWRLRPILGFGPSTFEYVFDKYYDPALLKQSFYETVSNKPHNILIEALTHTGLLGLLSYLGIFVAAIATLRKYRSETNRENIREKSREVNDAWLQAISIGLLTAYFLNLQFSFDTTNSWYMFIAFLAYLTSLSSRLNKNSYANKSVFHENIKTLKHKNKFVYVFSCFSALVIAAALWFGNIEAWAASVPAAKSENKYWLEKPIKWADEVKKAVKRRSPYHDEIRIILAQDLIKWEALGSLPMEEIQEQTASLIYKLESSAKRHSNNFQYLFTLAQIQGIWAENFDVQKFDEAIKLTKQAIQNSPRRQAAYLVLGKLLLQKGDLAAALDFTNQAVDLYKQAPEPHWFLGIIKSAAGELDQAVEEFILARNLGYDFRPPEIKYWMGVNKRRGREDQNRALDELFK